MPQRCLYDVLAVERDADDGQIKKAYHKAALAAHPDKNPGDEQAHERFQAVSHAYQILSQPDTRERYDKSGSEAFDPAKGGPSTIAPSLFFTMMFGARVFEPFVGTLMVTQICSLFDPDTDLTSRQLGAVGELWEALREELQDRSGRSAAAQGAWEQASERASTQPPPGALRLPGRF